MRVFWHLVFKTEFNIKPSPSTVGSKLQTTEVTFATENLTVYAGTRRRCGTAFP